MADLDTTNSSMLDTELQEEIGRRTLQISDLKEELWDLRDRVGEGDLRSNNLVHSLSQLANEIGVRKSAANALEDKVALLEASGDEQDRAFKKAVADAAEDLRLARAQIAGIEESSAKTLAQACAEKQRTEQIHVESASLRAKLEAARERMAHEQDELAQDEAAEAARQQRAERVFEEKEAEARNEIAYRVSAVSSGASAAKAQVLRLEQTLANERDTTKGLEAASRDAVSRQAVAQEECDAMKDELEYLELVVESRTLEDELEASRSHCHTLSKEVSTIQSEQAFKTQSLKGALDETRRMLADHLEKTQEAPVDPGFGIMVQALADARRRSLEAQASASILEGKYKQLQAEVLEAENSFSEAAQKVSDDHKRQHAELMQQLQSAQQTLRDAVRRADDKAADAAQAEAKVMETEKLLQQKEALLRRKLAELWSCLRQVN